ncbi:MAG: arsenate reductase family protein [Clostridiaceae bacterium]|nr:arsenate reductase family protein [Clostridiaceae bacterium]
MVFICYPRCTTCQKARKWLDDHDIEYIFRDIKMDRPTRAEIAAWQKNGNLPLKRFFNTSGLLYREQNLSKRIPGMSEDELLDLLATDGMMVKRPLLIGDDMVLVGFREKEWEERLG